ncbi:MAG TPA: hypothetical protein VGL40_03690 [Bacillota bacterium]|jgi:hypothetical protein
MPKFTKLPKDPEKPAKTVFASRHANLVLGGGPQIVAFQAGRFETDDPAVVEWLKNHRGCGTDFTTDEKPPVIAPAAPTTEPDDGKDPADSDDQEGKDNAGV